LDASNDHIDPIIFPLIEQWDEPPKAIQVLRVLDDCNRYRLASQITIQTLDAFLRIRMHHERITERELSKKAFWRIS
jgi:hypothetical protein